MNAPDLSQRKAEELVARAGGTPCYAVELATVSARVAAMRAALPASLQLCFAVKANPLPALLRHMSSLVDGADVSSAGELDAALEAGFAGASLGLTGPGKRDTELARAVAHGVRICAESIGEIERVARIAKAAGRRARVAVRVNPDIAVGGTRIRMSGDSFFGIDSEQAIRALQTIAALGLDFGGLHFYCASRMLDADEANALHARCLEEALQIARDAGVTLPWLNLGGGFGVATAADESPLDFVRVATALQGIERRLRAAHPQAQLALEPGRYLVAEAGHYLCSVIERKTVRGRHWLIVDGGAHQHLHATLQPDRLQPAAFPMTLYPRTPRTGRERVSIAGPLCAPFDVLARDVELPVAAPGDLLVLHCSGAYGASASPVNFLGHPPPAEIVF